MIENLLAMLKWKYWALLGILSVPILLRSASASPATIREHLQDILHEQILQSVGIGMDVELLGSRKKIFSYHASTPMTPASNLKLLTTGCALRRFGPNYRFSTAVMGDLRPDGVVNGNLFLKGSGDPSWNSDFFPNADAPLITLARELKIRGLQKITGKIVADDSIFDREFTGIGWKNRYQWDDYASEIAGLSLNYNAVKVTILPGHSLGSAPVVQVWPPSDILHVVNHAYTSSGANAFSIHRERLENTVTISGAVSRYSKGTQFLFNIHDPPLFVGSVFEEILKMKGISILGDAEEIHPNALPRTAGDPILAEVQSPPLIQIIHYLNKNSINFLAEHIFRALGAAYYGQGTIYNGQEAVCSCLKQMGIPKPNITMDDGSGLSGLDRVSPQILVGLLQRMATYSIGPAFKKTLPRAGEGTLEERLHGINVQAKTGAIRHVSALSGYLVTRYGQTVVFSIILNNFTFSPDEADILIDKFVRAIAAARGAL